VFDMAHIAGLVAGGVHPSPVPHAHITTTTTHKTLRGPRAGMTLCGKNYKLGEKADQTIGAAIDKAVFPGQQGGPLVHIIAAKAVAFGEALLPAFKDYSRRVVANAKALASELTAHKFRITSGGTDNHLMLVDLRPRGESLTGADAEKWLESAGIICNKNGIPDDPKPPRVTSGVRLGTPAVTTRGLNETDMKQIAAWIDRVLGSSGAEPECVKVRAEVRAMCERHPMPG
jgi:glycine hydroxymethyltransferase